MSARVTRVGLWLGSCCLLVNATACDSVKRETTDRVTPHEATAWTSREDCEELVAARPVSSRPPRIGTWNIRYFPDTSEGPAATADEATDVAWVACAIASLDLDILVVQEFKNSEDGLAKQQELVAGLNSLTQGDWQLELDQCEPSDVQHPGFLFDRTRVTATDLREITELNPDPVCSNKVSPGFAGYFGIEGGPDFHLIAVHGYTGAADSFEKRQLITAAMETVTADAYTVNPDTDVIFAGDFNDGGCTTCSPTTSNEDEVADFTATIASFETPLTLLPTTQPCSRVAEDMPLIDHVIAAEDMGEVPADSKVHVSGICEEVECDRQKKWLEDAYERLSDHCPLVLDLAAEDDD